MNLSPLAWAIPFQNTIDGIYSPCPFLTISRLRNGVCLLCNFWRFWCNTERKTVLILLWIKTQKTKERFWPPSDFRLLVWIIWWVHILSFCSTMLGVNGNDRLKHFINEAFNDWQHIPVMVLIPRVYLDNSILMERWDCFNYSWLLSCMKKIQINKNQKVHSLVIGR